MDERPTEEEGGAYYCQREDGYHGPFTRADLEAHLASGALSPGDLVRKEDDAVMQPLRLVLQLALRPAAIDELPGWSVLLAALGRRLRCELKNPSPRVLCVFLAIGAAGTLAARLGWLFWLPWFAFALAAAVPLLVKRRSFAALPIALCALAIPYLLWPRNHPPAVARAEVAPVLPPLPVLTPAELPALPIPPAVVLPNDPIAGLPPPAELPPATPAPVHATPTPAVAASAVPSFYQRPVAMTAVPAMPITAVPALQSAASAVRNASAERTGSLVIVRGDQGSGSGFIGRLDGKPYLFTNIHVAAGVKSPIFTLLDGTRLVPISSEAATHHDIMRFALKDLPRSAIDVAMNLDQKVRIDDDVVVLGNSGGGGVVTNLPGKIRGIGPDRIEVSSEFIPGNSGSPIIQVASGQVLGLATYLTRRRNEFTSAGAYVVRRYGYRIDSVKNWEPVNWTGFQAENEQIEKISQLTEDIYNFLGALRTNQTPKFATETLRRPATDWRQTISRKQLSVADRNSATQSFLSSLRYMVRSDVVAAESSLRYTYFRDRLQEERNARDALYKSFDTQLARLSAPSL